LCLWAEISTGPWIVHSSVIEKNIIISYENGVGKKERRGDFHLCLLSLLLLTVEKRV
jgi:hypothetical protein